MLKAIHVQNLRGIRSGLIEGLSQLTVLVGANGCGKSSVLDALLIGGGAAPGDAVGRVISRRVELWGGARWLFRRGARTGDPTVRIHIEVDEGPARDVTLRLMPDVTPANEEKLAAKRARPPYVEIESTLTRGASRLVALTAVAYGENVYAFRQDGPREPKEGNVRLVDPRPGGLHAMLWKSFTEAVEDHQLGEIEALLREVVFGLERLHILSDDAGLSVVHLGFKDHSVPVALAGDGIQTLVQVIFALAQPAGSVVLLEEPEATQHPRTIYPAAQAIVAAVKRGVQVILSTHSLDLIDGVRTLLADDPSPLTVHHLARVDGKLTAIRYGASELALARDAIGQDLR